MFCLGTLWTATNVFFFNVVGWYSWSSMGDADAERLSKERRNRTASGRYTAEVEGRDWKCHRVPVGHRHKELGGALATDSH